MQFRSNKFYFAHFIALSTIIIWSLTFVQTKVLLEYLTPIEILIDRFFLAWLLFFIFVPKIEFYKLKDEFLIATLGFSGIFAYYILENLALKYANAITVGLIVTTAPIFTKLFLLWFQEHSRKKIIFTLLGFLLVILGLIVMSYKNIYKLNIGDFLALLGALAFGIYSLLLSKVNKEYNILIVTRKSFFWGLLFLFLFFYFSKENFASIDSYKILVVWSNLLFLALIASGLCFLMWQYSVSIIGSSSTSNYIYLVPVINSIVAIFILDEQINVNIIFASILILTGLLISQKYGI